MVKISKNIADKQNNSNTLDKNQKPSFLKKIGIFSFRNTVLVFALLFLSFILIFTNRRIDGIYVKNYLSLFSDFIFTPSEKYLSEDGIINILVLGKSGEGHTAPDLTDTIMLTSVSLDDSSIRIVSVPRDIWIPEIRAKINSAYYWDKEKGGNGFSLPKETINNTLKVPVHYVVVFDFSSFTKIIDVLGGVQVEVENSFFDEKYPIYGKENDLCEGDREYKCRYETVSFEKGFQYMNGETALKFVRSRNAEGDEGTDIAREKRQQKVIYAVKNKILSADTLLSPKKIFGIWNVLKETLETDLNESSGVIVGRKIFNSRENIKSSVIPEDLLINPVISSRYDNQYVFVPKDENWDEIISWLSNFLN